MWWESLPAALSLVRQQIEFQNGLTPLNITCVPGQRESGTNTNTETMTTAVSLFMLWLSYTTITSHRIKIAAMVSRCHFHVRSMLLLLLIPIGTALFVNKTDLQTLQYTLWQIHETILIQLMLKYYIAKIIFLNKHFVFCLAKKKVFKKIV